jgi:hypothetical protein
LLGSAAIAVKTLANGLFRRPHFVQDASQNYVPGGTAMGWQDVWRVAMTVFVAEPVELRILIGLAVVFLALMVVVGLKHAFRSAEPRPERRQPEVAPKPVPHFAAAPLAMAAVAPEAAKSQQQPFRVSGTSVRAPRKSVKQTIKPFAPPRPKIHRASVQLGRQPHFTDEHAPFSPLPPHG